MGLMISFGNNVGVNITVGGESIRVFWRNKLNSSKVIGVNVIADKSVRVDRIKEFKKINKAGYVKTIPFIIGSSEVMIQVEFDYYKARPATGPSFSCGGEPAEPPEVDIYRVIYNDIDIIEMIPSDEIENLENEIIEDKGYFNEN